MDRRKLRQATIPCAMRDSLDFCQEVVVVVVDTPGFFIAWGCPSLVDPTGRQRHRFADLFSRRFREGISFPRFVESASWNCPSPSCVLFPWLYRTKHFLRGEKGKKALIRREEEGWPAKGAKRKKDAWKQVSLHSASCLAATLIFRGMD